MDPLGAEVLDRIIEFKELRKNVTDPDYWRRLNPECSVTDEPFPKSLTPYAVSRAATQRHLEQIRKEGYFHTSPLLEPWEISKLRRCITSVVNRGHHASYALVYDDFYHVMARLTNVLSPILGAGFQLVPDEYWAYYIPAQDQAIGSAPHRDSLRTATSVEADGTPTLVNVWIPLTDATTLNSCMYVLPAHLDPYYPHREKWSPSNSSPYEIDLKAADLQSVRALPAQAGSVLCWSTHLLHWGARSSEYAAHPRISFAVYYQSRRVPTYHEVAMDIPSPLSFLRRLHLIEKVWRGQDSFRHTKAPTDPSSVYDI
jgi:hypothetical protein